MDLIGFAIRRPVTVSVGVVLIILFGLISFTAIPIQLTPNIETTVVSVTTEWEGASPKEVETEIVEEQEEKLKRISGLRKMFSVCRLGEAEITLEFVQGVSKALALREVSNKLREVPSYPDNVEEPTVEASNPNQNDHIAWVILSETDPNFDVTRLHDLAEDRLKPTLERVKGISEVAVYGGAEREVQIRVRPKTLAQRGISPAELARAIRRENQNISGGDINEGKREIRVRSVGRYDTLEAVKKTVISRPGDPAVRVEDVADVRLTFKEAERVVRNKGREVIAMNAKREVGSNVMQVMSRFKERLAHIRENLLPAAADRYGIDGEIHYEQVYDQTVYIDRAIRLVKQNLWVGGGLAVLVLLLFLRSVRSTVIIALAIPVSVIGTFVAMAGMGRTINVISLAGMAFAIGIVVDNAIVVLENIDRHRRLGRQPSDASYGATQEVWGAILASTLTTLCVFIPILTVQQEAGQLFRDISLAICAAVTLSLLVSITVIPSAASRWLGTKSASTPADRPAGRTRRSEAASRARALLRLPSTVVWGLGHLVERLGGSWVVRPLIIGGLTAGAVVGAYQLMPPASYLPKGNRNLVFAMLFTPPGYNLEQQRSVGKRIEQRLRPYWEARDDPKKAKRLTVTNPKTGEKVPSPTMENFFFVAVRDRMFMGGISADPTRIRPIKMAMNNAVKGVSKGRRADGLPGVRGLAKQRPLFETASRGADDAIELEIYGPNLAEVERVASALQRRIIREGVPPRRVRPTPTNFDLPTQEVRVVADRVQAANLGVDQAGLNTAVQMFGDGAVIGDFLHRGDTIDLKILADLKRTGGRLPNDAAYMADQPVATPAGKTVPLGSLAKVRRSTAPQQISRVEEQRAVTLQVILPKGAPLEQWMDRLRNLIEEGRENWAEAGGQSGTGLTIPPTVRTNLAGSAAKLRKVKRALLGEWTGLNWASFVSLLTSRAFLALVVVFLLMAALFENWLYPLVILISVPVATLGGFIGLRLVHEVVPTQQLDILTMLGFIILIGVVVNNAILIVHQALNLMRGRAAVRVGEEVVDSLPPQQAIAQAVRSRVRPIFMSMTTSVGGMLPLVLFPGAGSELYRGLGSVVVGGLIVSTVFTLVLVPLLLSLVFDLRSLVGRFRSPTPAVPTPAGEATWQRSAAGGGPLARGGGSE